MALGSKTPISDRLTKNLHSNKKNPKIFFKNRKSVQTWPFICLNLRAPRDWTIWSIFCDLVTWVIIAETYFSSCTEHIWLITGSEQPQGKFIKSLRFQFLNFRTFKNWQTLNDKVSSQNVFCTITKARQRALKFLT